MSDSGLGSTRRDQPNPFGLDASGDERAGDLSTTSHHLNGADLNDYSASGRN